LATRDVTVIGAGIFGLSIAYACARRGAKVQVIERQGIGAGSSGGIVGALSPHTPENWNDKKQFQFESLMMAGPFWADIDTLSGLNSGYGRIGRLQGLADARAIDLAQQRGINARDLWQGQATWTVIDATTDPWQPPSSTGQLIHDTLSARLHPARACASLAAAIVALGGSITIGDAPHQGTVIWATGAPGLRDLSEVLAKPIGAGIKGQALLLNHDARNKPQLFIDGLHIIPHDEGTTAIGSTTEREFEKPDTTDALLDALHARAIAALPVLRGAKVVQRWAGLRPRARSRAPLLGPWPDRPGHFIANGGFKIGFGMAPRVAQVMADLVLDQNDAIPEGFHLDACL